MCVFPAVACVVDSAWSDVNVARVEDEKCNATLFLCVRGYKRCPSRIGSGVCGFFKVG